MAGKLKVRNLFCDAADEIHIYRYVAAPIFKCVLNPLTDIFKRAGIT
jgi:hypothetical protein